MTRRECSDLAHVEPVRATEDMENVVQDYRRGCAKRTLMQQQQVNYVIGFLVFLPLRLCYLMLVGRGLNQKPKRQACTFGIMGARKGTHSQKFTT